MSPARITPAAPLPLALLAALACNPPGDADEPAPPPELADYGLAPLPSTDHVATLAWQAPAACPQAYRVRIDESYPPGLETMLRARAEHSESWLALADQKHTALPTWPKGPVPKDSVFVGRTMFRGPKTQNKPLQRELALSAALAGPASPDAPCYERTWDPVEDALALGWPQLPARLTALGETWRGARVEARCNRSACVDTRTRGGGPDNHFRPCATMSWRERLDGIYTVGDEQVAVISSFWSDGHPLDEGLWSERTAVVSVDHGRLLHSQTLIHHTYTGIEREVRIDAVDDCPGGLMAAGWSPDAPVTAARDELLATLNKSRSEGR